MTNATAIALIKTEAELVAASENAALQLFTTPNAIDPLLEHIRNEINGFEGDTTTPKGRKAIASMAYKVARSKTAIDDVGKRLTAEQKKIPAIIDGTRKHVRDTLDKWRDEVRAPLDAWEDAEQHRINSHTSFIQHIVDCGNGIIGGEVQPIGLLIAELEDLTINEDLEEFEAEAHRAKDDAMVKLKTALDEQNKREAEQAELARLRAEEEARKTAEHEARIAREAAAKAKAEAEAKAAAQAAALKEAERKRELEAERKELELKLAAEQAERRAVEAEAKARQEAKESAEREAAEAAKRKADEAHRNTIHTAAINAITSTGISEALASKLMKLIADGGVPHVVINY